MTQVIAVAGKGGVGKTTICGLLIQYLCETGRKPVLAVDADANSNLNEVLGVETQKTMGEIRESMKTASSLQSDFPDTMTKDVYLEQELHASITEEDDFDLLVMGRSQGQGCYCFVNSLLQKQIYALKDNYPYIVVDNEAGMEHLSRGILPHLDIAILVSDCSRRGVQATGRIAQLMKELKLTPQKVGLIVNRAPGGELNQGTLEEIKNQGLELIGVIPADDTIYQYDCDGEPLVNLPPDSPVRKALQSIVEKLGL